MHKCFEKIPSLRPTISGFNCVSGNLPEYAESLLKYQAKTCKSYIRDTSGFLLKRKSLSTAPSTSILVTKDVSNLYINMDLKESGDVCNKMLKAQKN